MSNILIVTPKIPCPPDDGFRIRIFNFIKSLSDKNKIYLLSIVTSPEEKQRINTLLPFCTKIYTISNFSKRSWLKIKLDSVKNILMENIPYGVKQYYFEEVASQVNQIIKRHNIKILYLYYAWMGVYIDDLSEQTYKILDSCDAFSRFYRQNYLNSKIITKKIRFYFEWKKMTNIERNLFPKFDKVLTVSPFDSMALKEINPNINIEVISNGVDLKYFQKTDEVETKINELIFTGTMNYGPNVDAVLFFYRQILPLIKKRIPDVIFNIVGKSPSKHIINISIDPSLNVTGKVLDIRPYMERSNIFVCPLRYGAGIKNKVLEAMAMGLPVVCTKISNEGIGAVNGRDLLIADNPQSFADAAIKIMLNKDLRQSLSVNSRNFVESNFDWSIMASKIQSIIDLV